jgi:hypothetical protein
LRAILTDEVGTGYAVFNNSPVFGGNVGIGTTAPRTTVDVSGVLMASNIIAQASAANYGSISINQSGNANTGSIQWRKGDNVSAMDAGTRLGYMGYSATDILLALENGADFVVSAGNVGVKTINPIMDVEIQGTQASPASSGKDGMFRYGNIGAGPVVDFGQGAGEIGWAGWIQVRHYLYRVYTYPLLLNPTGGNVGVQTTAPATAFDVNGIISIDNGGNLSYGIQQYFVNNTLGANYRHKVSTSHSSSSANSSNVLISPNNATSGGYSNALNVTGAGRIGVNLSDLPDYTVEAGGDIRSNGALRAQELILDVTSVHPSVEGSIRIYMP